MGVGGCVSQGVGDGVGEGVGEVVGEGVNRRPSVLYRCELCSLCVCFQ